MIESQIDQSLWRDSRNADHTTFSECLNRYLKEVTPKKKGAKQEICRASVILRASLCSKYMSAIRGADVASFRDVQLALGKSPSTIQKYLALISHVFTIARCEWQMESLINPVQNVRKPVINNARNRRLRIHEETYLTIACKQSSNIWLLPIVQLALETAMRKGELLSLRWEHIDLNRAVAHLPDTKSGEFRNVPLSSRSISILESLPRSIHGEVFKTTDNAIKLAFIRALKRSCLHVKDYRSGKKKSCTCNGIEDFRFHDLRHEAITRLAKVYEVHELAKVTGHKTLQVLLRYYHPDAEELAEKLHQYEAENSLRSSG